MFFSKWLNDWGWNMTTFHFGGTQTASPKCVLVPFHLEFLHVVQDLAQTKSSHSNGGQAFTWKLGFFQPENLSTWHFSIWFVHKCLFGCSTPPAKLKGQITFKGFCWESPRDPHDKVGALKKWVWKCNVQYTSQKYVSKIQGGPLQYPVISRVITVLACFCFYVCVLVKKSGGHSFASPESRSQETLDPLIESSDSNLSLSSPQMSQIESHHVQ